MSSELGDALARARAIKRRSLRAVAGPAEISPAYLQKLERGDVRDPSPNVLYRLSGQLDIDYAELMRAAGYVMPGGGEADRALRGAIASHALSTEPLSKDEETALTSYLGYLRSQKARE